jgi:hypothetical protein
MAKLVNTELIKTSHPPTERSYPFLRGSELSFPTTYLTFSETSPRSQSSHFWIISYDA